MFVFNGRRRFYKLVSKFHLLSTSSTVHFAGTNVRILPLMELLLIYNIQFIYAANLIPTVNELKGLLSKYKPLTKKQKQDAIAKEAKVKLIT